MRSIIYTFIFVKTLKYLNSRITTFEFSSLENSNKPPIITVNRIKNKLNLKISAAEMLCLTRYFGLIMGDLIPEDDQHYQLYKYCVK